MIFSTSLSWPLKSWPNFWDKIVNQADTFQMKYNFTAKNIISHDFITCGKTLSSVSISLLNRLRTLPKGVVSNNSMGQRRTFFNRCSCITFAERTNPNDKFIDTAKLNRTKRTKFDQLKYLFMDEIEFCGQWTAKS